jgi:general secretion pathway protein E
VREVPSLEQLGFEADVVRVLRASIARTQGILLVTGPTGSGKSTTLYALARQIKDGGRNVVSVEDPVESHLPGIVQVPVNDEQGLTYPRAIRSVLRHDPDVIMLPSR